MWGEIFAQVQGEVQWKHSPSKSCAKKGEKIMMWLIMRGLEQMSRSHECRVLFLALLVDLMGSCTSHFIFLFLGLPIHTMDVKMPTS